MGHFEENILLRQKAHHLKRVSYADMFIRIFLKNVFYVFLLIKCQNIRKNYQSFRMIILLTWI